MHLKKSLLYIFAAVSLSTAAKAQVRVLDDKNPFSAPADSALTAMLNDAADKGAKTTYRIKDDSTLSVMLYPKSRGIAFLHFKDTSNDGIYARKELTYAEYSDAYAQVLVRADDSTGVLSVEKKLARSSVKDGEAYKSAAAAYKKDPLPEGADGEDAANWVIGRLTRREGPGQ
jgi:hypothetical protein